MGDTIKASVIITTYDRPKFLARAVASCFRQNTNSSYEIIVVDDNGLGSHSQRETEKLITTEFSKVVYIPLEKNYGACIARNRGAESSNGNFLFFLDDDDEFLPNKIKAQVDFLNGNYELDGCLAAFIRIGENRKEIISESNSPVVGDFKNFVLNGNFFTPMLCIRKDSFLKSGGFIDIPRFQDRFYLMNALSKGLKFGTLQEPLHIMYEHTEGRITGTSIEKTKKSLQQISTWIASQKESFTKIEQKKIEAGNLHKLATTYYNSRNWFLRKKAMVYYVRLFLTENHFSDLLMSLKSLIK